MNFSRMIPVLGCAGLVARILVWPAGAAMVEVRAVPEGGIQPQVAVDEDGAVHLIYFRGEPMGGDVYYTKQASGRDGFAPARRVNQREGSAVATGTIRGAHLAVGRQGRPHVVWNGSAATHGGDHASTPLLYARGLEGGAEFEPERNIITFAYGLDGGSSVAADAQGRVHVVWHAPPPGNERGEAGRAVYGATSTDDGATFARERVLSPPETGACGCCGLKAYADPAGDVFVLYRGARGGSNRDEIFLASQDGGANFREVWSHPWELTACPMSSAFIGPSPGGVFAAWETQGQLYFTAVDAGNLQYASFQSPSGTGPRKHPVAARNARGETLLAWVEGSGWNRGGTLVWQVLDREGKPTMERGREPNVPVWSLAACYARPDMTFVILR